MNLLRNTHFSMRGLIKCHAPSARNAVSSLRGSKLPMFAVNRRVSLKSSGAALNDIRSNECQNITSSTAQVYSYGEAGYIGAMGHGNFESMSIPKKIEQIADIPIKQISAGWYHSGLISEDGKVFVFGRTHGFKNAVRTVNVKRGAPWLISLINWMDINLIVEAPTPVELDLPQDEIAKTISCSAALTAVLTQSGKLFTYGANNYGQCGIGNDTTNVWKLTEVEAKFKMEPIVDVATGFQHCLALDRSGRVYSWGKGDRGQLGHANANSVSPHLIESGLSRKKIVRVGAGFSHSVALSNKGELYVWGKLLGLAENGAAVQKSSSIDQTIPRLVKTLTPVQMFAASQFHTTFLTDDGKLWVLGRSQNTKKIVDNRLVPVRAEMLTTPLLLSDHEALSGRTIRKLCRGLHSTIILTDDNAAFEFSWENGIVPIESLANVQVYEMEKGFQHSLVLGEPSKP